jgi:3-oxoacyl-[acyl-carrier protein] reductase
MSTPKAPLQEHAAAVDVRITSALVSRFAALTGDRSNLHVDDAFARRSAYREPVVHGMLPIACLALLPTLHRPGRRAVIRKLSARFAAAVLPGDALTIAADAPVATQDDLSEVPFRIARDRAVVTAGSLTVAYEPASTAVQPATNTVGGMLPVPLDVRTFHLEDAPQGTSDELEFSLTAGVLWTLARLIGDASSSPEASAPAVAEHVDLASFAPILLYSTSIGVSLPGATATFLEFSAQVEATPRLDTPYRLRGTITHRSMSTRILKKELLVMPAGSDEVLVRGKASTLVAKPFSQMPTVDDLRQAGTDLGLRGKVVLVTGASRGIGETTAKLLALHGARVVVNYHRGESDAARVVDEIARAGGEALAVRADVSDEEDVRTLVRAARAKFGTVHVLVNNAARDYRPIAFQDLTWTDIQKDIDVIVKGAFLCCQEVLPLMLAQGEGRIISISTVATDDPPADQTKYVVAKSALVGLTRSISIEFAARNIQANLVVPNFVETDFVSHIPDGFRKKIARDIPMQRAASAVDVAKAVVFLASGYASFTTGQKVMVTGGGAPYL